MIHESSGGCSPSRRTSSHLTTKKVSANDKADFLSRTPAPVTEHDRSGSARLNPGEGTDIYLVRTCEQRTLSSPIPRVVFGGILPSTVGIALSGLAPRTELATLGTPLFASAYFYEFCTRGPRERINGHSSFSGRLIPSCFRLLRHCRAL